LVVSGREECVRDRDGCWHVAAGPSTDDAWSRPIVCGGVIVLPGNPRWRVPNCPQCLRLLADREPHRPCALRTPCPSCPWRTDQAASDIPRYRTGLAEALAVTSPNERGVGPDLDAPQFACHQSLEGEEFACAGWLATQGHRHPAVRLAVTQGRIPPEALAPGEDWPELHATFGEMLAKLRASHRVDA